MQVSKKLIQIAQTQEDTEVFTAQESFMDSVNNCPICGTGLEFEYRTEAFDNALSEKAHCGECQIRIRDQHFSVH